MTMRKTIWAGAIAGMFLALGLCARGELGALPEDWQKATNYLVPWTDGKSVVIRDFKGRDLLKLCSVGLAYPKTEGKKDGYSDYSTRIKSAEQLDPNIVRVNYEIHNAGIKEHYALIVSEGGPRLRIENRVVLKEGAPGLGTVSPGAVCRNKISLKPVGESALAKAFVRGGVWRKPANGESYEASGATLVPYVVPEGELFLWYDSIGAFRGRPYVEFCLRYRSSDVAEALRDAQLTVENAKGVIMPATGEYFAQVHGDAAGGAAAKPDAAPAKPDATNAAERAYSNVINFYLLPWKDAAFVAAALQTGAPLAAAIKTGKDFNLFDSSKEKPSFDVVMMNARNAPAKVTCKVVARNYDGRADLSKTVTESFAPYELKTRRFDLPTDRKREYWFVNAEFDDGTTNSFVRADIATIEPYAYKSLDTSVMGIAASFDIPSAEACDRLLTRMGARWIRTDSGAGTERFAAKNRCGILSFHLDAKATNEAQRLAFATEKLKEAVARDCSIVEIGNELNFGARGAEITKRVAGYRDWLQSFFDARAALKLEDRVKISTFGFAGCVDGGTFYHAMDKAGCWDYCDILSLHPGRLNQTPDNPGPDWAWNYRPQIQSTKGFMRELRAKKQKNLGLILTEVYARTPPNKNDSDSTRSAAENVVLSCALAKIEGVTALNWYQLHDSVHSNKGGINEWSTEYHYGLLRRDGTVKPSVLAFCTISEALDGATFEREANYEDRRKAWFFTTPHGPMAILYDRKDGYFPYDGMFTKRPFTGHLEPWLDHWKSHTDYYYDAPRGFVIVRDAIGRMRKVKADKQGRVKLTLSGAPVIVYGLGAPVAEKPRPPLELVVAATDADVSSLTNDARTADGAFVRRWENKHWILPRKLLGDILWRTREWKLPCRVVDFGPVGFEAWRAKGREKELADAQFFGSLLLLASNPDCRAVELHPFGDSASRQKTFAFAKTLLDGFAAPEISVGHAGLRTLRFWRGGERCAVVWQGNRNWLWGWDIDDLTGRPQATSCEVEVVADKKAKLKVFDIYGEEQKVEVKNGKATLTVGDVPLVLVGCKEIR